MARRDKIRDIDFSTKELLSLSGCKSIPDLRNKLQRICEIYPELDVSNFKLYGEENYNYFFPPDYAELIAILIKNIDAHPDKRKNGKAIERTTGKDIQEYNERMLCSISKLPAQFNAIISELPCYHVSEDLSEWTEMLTDQLTRLVISITSLNDGDIGQSMKWLCRELDIVNYNLYRGQYISSEMSKGFIKDNKDIHKKIIGELSDLTEEERNQKFMDCPSLKMIYEKEGERSEEILSINQSIDTGIVKLIIILMERIKIKDMKTGITEIELSYKHKCGEIDKERELYYNDILQYWEDLKITFANGKIQLITANGKKWRGIISKIRDGEFFEDYEAEAQKYRNRADSIDNCLKLSKEVVEKVSESYVKYCDSIRDSEMYNIVDDFVGSVLYIFLENK